MPYRESEAVRVIHQVLNALVYMHNRNIVHRDMYVAKSCVLLLLLLLPRSWLLAYLFV